MNATVTGSSGSNNGNTLVQSSHVANGTHISIGQVVINCSHSQRSRGNAPEWMRQLHACFRGRLTDADLARFKSYSKHQSVETPTKSINPQHRWDMGMGKGIKSLANEVITIFPALTPRTCLLFCSISDLAIVRFFFICLFLINRPL